MTDDLSLQLAPEASPDEAAAITAAVEAWLAAEARASGEAEAARAWAGRRFAFAGRLEKLTGAPGRVPAGAPTDPWTAAGRRDRF